MNVQHYRELVIQPTLHLLGLHSEAAENLLLGTIAQETQFESLKQLSGGPALGLYQIEPSTHRDLWENYLQYRQEMLSAVAMLRAQEPSPLEQLITNRAYATAIARLIYFRVPEALPQADDIEGMAAYWKKHFNTPEGKGTIAQFIMQYKEFVR